MKQLWETIKEEDLNILEETLDDNMKYEGSEGIRKRFAEKIQNNRETDNQTNNQDEEACEMQKSAFENTRKKPGKKRRRIYLVLAAALVLVCGIGAAASYTTWHLPQPETYEGEVMKVEETSTYAWDEEKQTYVDAEGEVPFTDSYFMEQTQEILKLIAAENVDFSQMTVTYQKDEWWNREEAMVTFSLQGEEGATSVTFDRESGYFLQAEYWAHDDGEGTVMSDEEALAAAKSWYEKLPYPQGYEYTNVVKISDDADWMYYFSKKLDVEVAGETLHLTNDYEQVRITINPITGDFVLCNVFYVPLLDDHQEGDTPLTEEEAEKIAAQVPGMESVEKTSDVTAEIKIVHPNYFYSSQDIEEDLRHLSVSRLAWEIMYEFPCSECGSDYTYVDVDLYTGEVLGGDSTK